MTNMAIAIGEYLDATPDDPKPKQAAACKIESSEETGEELTVAFSGYDSNCFQIVYHVKQSGRTVLCMRKRVWIHEGYVISRNVRWLRRKSSLPWVRLVRTSFSLKSLVLAGVDLIPLELRTRRTFLAENGPRLDSKSLRGTLPPNRSSGGFKRTENTSGRTASRWNLLSGRWHHRIRQSRPSNFTRSTHLHLRQTHRRPGIGRPDFARADGMVGLVVIEKPEGNDRVVCRVDRAGCIRSRQGVNLPGVILSTPSLTEKDYVDLKWAG